MQLTIDGSAQHSCGCPLRMRLHLWLSLPIYTSISPFSNFISFHSLIYLHSAYSVLTHTYHRDSHNLPNGVSSEGLANLSTCMSHTGCITSESASKSVFRLFNERLPIVGRGIGFTSFQLSSLLSHASTSFCNAFSQGQDPTQSGVPVHWHLSRSHTSIAFLLAALTPTPSKYPLIIVLRGALSTVKRSWRTYVHWLQQTMTTSAA